MEKIFSPYEVIIKQGDASDEIFYIKSGKVLVCTLQGTQVKALDRINEGEFIGELSFFDRAPRSTFVVALETSTIVKFERKDLADYLPYWFMEAGKGVTKKIRTLNKILQESFYKKASSEDQKPLSVEEQRKILSSINNQ